MWSINFYHDSNKRPSRVIPWSVKNKILTITEEEKELQCKTIFPHNANVAASIKLLYGEKHFWFCPSNYYTVKNIFDSVACLVTGYSVDAKSYAVLYRKKSGRRGGGRKGVSTTLFCGLAGQLQLRWFESRGQLRMHSTGQTLLFVLAK